MKLRAYYLIYVLLLFGPDGWCQKVFLVAGQSNASGVGDSKSSPICLPNTAFEYSFTSNSLITLKDPTGIDELGFEKAKSGSAWPAFAKSYNALTDEQVVIIQAAKGGSSCNPDYYPHLRWDVDGELLKSAILKTQNALALINRPLSGVIWIQGEADAVFINDKKFSREGYKRSLRNSINSLREMFGGNLPFYIVQTGLADGLNPYGFEQIQLAQEEIAKEVEHCSIIYPFTKLFLDAGLMGDYIHYNQKGYDVVGRSCAHAIHEIEKTGKLVSQVLENDVFPNPARYSITARFSNISLERNARLTILDVEGHKVLSLEVDLAGITLESVELNVTDFKSGSYILKIEVGRQSSTIKFKVV